MNLQSYLVKKKFLKESEPQFRTICKKCRQPDFSCYCQSLLTIDPGIRFVILIHPIEYRRRIATGRMAHLCLKNSLLIEGEDYSKNEKLNSLINDNSNQCFILYPGKNSLNLNKAGPEATRNLFKFDRNSVIFVIDGTWSTARRMVRLSQNIANLPRLSFTPRAPSRFRVRKQPAEHCLSTIEAVHELLLLVGPLVQEKINLEGVGGLITCFDAMVEKQLKFIENSKYDSRKISYRTKSVASTSESKTELKL